MTDLNLICGVMVIMFTVAVSMMVYDSCDISIMDKVKENERFEKRWMRQTIKELGEALNR